MDRVEMLIRVLLDKDAPIGDRDDAAMDLGQYNDQRALNALLKIATNPNEDSFIFDVCGESIASLWVKRDSFDLDSYQKLMPPAKRECYGYIEVNKPEWIKNFNLMV